MKKILLFSLLLLPILTFAQSLSGNYIIGSNQPFPFNTLTNAVARVNAFGVSGPTVFLLNDATYSASEVFPIKIVPLLGSSTVNTLKIKPNVGKTVTISANPVGNGYTGVPATIQIDGADNIIIDGSNTQSGSSRDLTIANNDNISYLSRTAIWVSSNGSNGANNIIISNTKINMLNKTPDYLQFSGIFSGSNSLGSNSNLNGTAATAANSQLTVKNNEFLNVRQAIIFKGSPDISLESSNITVSLNKIGASIDAEKPSTPMDFSNVNNVSILDNSIIGVANLNNSDPNLGLVFENVSNCIIKRNIFQDIKTTSLYTGKAIWFKGLTTNLEISENKISNIKNTINGVIYGIHLDVNNSSTGILIANNFISDISTTIDNEYSDGTFGIYIANGTGTRIFYNTVALNTTDKSKSATLYIAGGSGFDIRNNIFSNTSGTGGQRYAIYANLSATAFTNINYNDYYATNIGYLDGIKRTTLVDWKTATGKDANSQNILPVFTSVSDLHLPAATNATLDNKGQVIAGFTTDIDQTSRSTTTPDIGADEFFVAAALAAEPTTQSTALTFTNVTANGFNLNLIKGNGTNRIVVIRSGTAVNANPNDATNYTAAAQFAAGTQIGTGNYVVYNGSSNTVSVTGLSGATTYHVAVYEYNGSAATANYLTNSPLRGNQKTINATLGWQIANTNTVNTINFDTNVTGVNNGPFLGNGIAVSPISGQLNSNAWALTGLEDGSILFGETNTNLDLGRGVENGGVNNGGVYAFKTGSNNAALGIQPSPVDFVPGSVTLRFQNQTSGTITAVSIGYKVYIYNDQNTSSSFNFSHSADNTTFTSISQLDVISPETAEVSPTWKASYRVATITGLNIPANGFYYLKWSGASVVLGSAYDEFALDDIVLSANPTSNYVAFSGTAENFSIHGNTNLSGNTIVNGDLKFTAGKLSINSNTLTIGGTVINTIFGALKGSATSNISVNGTGDKTLSFDQTTLGTTNVLNNLALIFSDPKTVSISNPVVVNGNLNIGLDQTLNLGINALQGNLATITVNGNLRTQNNTALPFPTGKSFIGTGTVVYDATTAQTFVSGTYNNVTLSSPAGTTAAGAITVNGTLNLPLANPSATKGGLDMGSNVLTMGPKATNIGQGDVTGITTRNSIAPNTLYTFGNPNISILFPNVGTLPTALSLKTVIGNTPTWQTGAIKRTYDFIQTGGVGTKAVIRGHYLDAELNGNDENKLVDFAHIYATGTTIDQGRSNFDTEDNWIELTNINVGQYFTNTFGDVNLTFDESTSVFATWNGSQSNSWTTAANWTPNGTPSDDTAVLIPDAASTPNDPTINPLNLLGSITIAQGGIVNTPVGSQLKVKGGSGAWINNGTFNAGTGTNSVIFTNINATIAGATNFNNVTISAGAGLRPLSGNIMRIAGLLALEGTFTPAALENTIEYNGTNQTVVLPSGLGAYHNLIISGTGAVFPTSLRILGNLTIDKPVNFAGKTIVMNGSELQSISGNVAPQFYNLTINNSKDGVVLNTNTTVSQTLDLTAGNLNISNFDLTLGANSVTGTFGVTKMIVAEGTGFVRRPFTSTGSYFFPIGELTSNPAYSPITVNVTSGSFSNAFVAVSVVDAIHPDNHSLQNYISRYWKVSQTGITNAVATVTANYITQEVLVPESTLAAAQLTGDFNLQTNPWIRFAALNNLTLTAAGAILQAGAISYFTAIKGGDFSVSISGGGTFCENEPVTLSSEIIGGDQPFSYNWSNGLGIETTAKPPVTNIGTANYTLTVIDANGIKATNSTEVTTNPAAIAGTLFTNETICYSYEPDDIVLSGNSAPVSFWQRSDNPSFTNPIVINNTSNTLGGAAAGEIIGKTYFRAAINNGTCATVFTDPVVIDNKTTTWDGNNWSNGLPDSATTVVISGDYNVTTSLNACSLTIINNAKVDVPEDIDVTLLGSVAVISGKLTFESDANLIQISEEANFGNMDVKRNSASLFRLDYTMWGSPLQGSQKLIGFSPLTNENRFYTYNSTTDKFKTIVPSTNGFTPGMGYLIRMPNNHIEYTAQALAVKWTGTFTGVANNGLVAVNLSPRTVGNGYNMVSNPYASTIDADAFLEDNENEIESTIYFWRRRNNVPIGTETNSAYYATYTPAGGTGVATAPSESSEIPNGFIQVGQGFIVQAKAIPTNGILSFKNSMRSKENNDNQFFRSSNKDNRSRIWLNVTGVSGEFGQTLLAYMPLANNDVDRTDGKYIKDGAMALTSWLDNSEYIIQGRAPFETSDIVTMNFKTAKAGNYTIAIDKTDGIFSKNQNIYLRDKLTNIEHDLKTGSYTFASEVGSFNNRFEIFYQKTLGVDQPQLMSNNVIVYKENKEIVINSGIENMDAVKIYDLSGRLLFKKNGINASEFKCNIAITDQVLIVKINVGSKTISRKIIN